MNSADGMRRKKREYAKERPRTEMQVAGMERYGLLREIANGSTAAWRDGAGLPADVEDEEADQGQLIVADRLRMQTPSDLVLFGSLRSCGGQASLQASSLSSFISMQPATPSLFASR